MKYKSPNEIQRERAFQRTKIVLFDISKITIASSQVISS